MLRRARETRNAEAPASAARAAECETQTESNSDFSFTSPARDILHADALYELAKCMLRETGSGGAGRRKAKYRADSREKASGQASGRRDAANVQRRIAFGIIS